MGYALIIDDDEKMVESITTLMSDHGLSLDSANTWDEGFAGFLATSPELVIADYNLPGSKHGLRLLFEIARLRPTVRLILFSAYVTKDDVGRIEDLGLADLVLQKLNPVASGRTLLLEVAAARDRALGETNWTNFAASARRGRRVTDEDLEQLDGFLREHRLPRGTVHP